MKKLVKYLSPAMVLGNYYNFTPQESKEISRNIKGKVSQKMMNGVNYINNFSGGPTSVLDLYYTFTDSRGPLQDYFLTDKNTQNELILNSGLYIPGTDRDKKLSKRLFNGNYRVYRRGLDLVDRNKLIFLGLGDDGGQYAISSGIGDQELINPGSYPSAWYVDNDGYLYRLSFDLNDYGGPGGSTSGIAGRILDRMGNPVVLTTGLIKQIEEGKHINLFNDKNFENTEAYKSISDMLKRKGKTLQRINGRMEIILRGPTIVKHRKHKNGGIMEKKLIPKALFGTGIVRRGIRWIGRHMAPTLEQTMFQVNQTRLKQKKKNITTDDPIILQTKLQQLGYYKGNIDGKIGPKTRAAIQQALNDGYKINYNLKLLIKRPDNSISLLQQQLKDKGFYEGNIDGKMGTKTRAAITMAGIKGYSVVDNKLVEKQLKKENLQHLLKQTGNYSINNPIVRTILDWWQATQNRVYERDMVDPQTGLPLRTKPVSQTIKRIPIELELVLQELIKFKGTPKSGGFTSSDWKALQGTYTGKGRSMIERSFGALSSIEHCLGLFNWHTNNKGEIVVTDTYDWNVGSTSKDLGWYTSARDFMGEHGTQSDAPDNQKTKYEINLGKPENW